VVGSDGEVTEIDGAALSPEVSAEVFGRTGTVARIEVDLSPAR
jgi:hypothetical protein